MKWIAIGATALIAMPVVLTVTVAVIAISCVTDPAACAKRVAGHAPTAPGDPPTNGASGAADLTTVGEAVVGGVPSYSILRHRSAYGTGWGGPSVNLLAPHMKVAVARLERAMGQRLLVVSGYRTAGYQAQLCQLVTGPCAPPGRSMHQLGLAVDVINWQEALLHLDRVGLCQPLPDNDAVHLSHVTGREC